MNNMLKKNVKLPVKRMLLGIIKSYVRLPISRIVKAKLDIRSFDNTETNLPKEFVNSYAFIGNIYKHLTAKIGKEKAFEIMRISLGTVAFMIQQHNFKTVEDGRSFSNLVRNQKKANSEGSTKMNTMVILEDNKTEYIYKVTKCMFFKLFEKLEVPELTSIMCSVDNAIFNFYLPNSIVFSRKIGNTIFEGKKECDFSIKNFS